MLPAMMLEKIRTALSELQLTTSGAVARFELRVGRDSTNDSAVWVYVVVHDSRIESLWPEWDQLRQDIRDAVATVAGPDVVTYIRMWAESEVREAQVTAS
jgi:hypothetical protein